MPESKPLEPEHVVAEIPDLTGASTGLASRKWRRVVVCVNNASGSTTAFDVYVVCEEAKGYQLIVSSSLTVPPGTQGSQIETCPVSGRERKLA